MRRRLGGRLNVIYQKLSRAVAVVLVGRAVRGVEAGGGLLALEGVEGARGLQVLGGVED